MRRSMAILLTIGLFLACIPARAAIESSPPIALPCKSALLMEPDSGQVIFEFNADEPQAIASVTKIMPILLACEAVESGRCKLSDKVNISRRAASMGGSQVLLETGEAQPLDALLKSMIVASANDATVAIGEFLFGSEQAFLQRMNDRAKALGMTATRFVNATGLPTDGHVSTARDVASMSAALIRHPLYFTYSGIWMDTLDHGDGRVTELTNTNRLTRLYAGCDGLKTGSTKEAGYCMSASAKRDDMRLIAVVLGAPTSKERFETAAAMLDYGFANYRLYAAAKAGTRIRGRIPVQGGASDFVDGVLARDLSLLLSKNDAQNVELRASLVPSVQAPIPQRAPLGHLEVLLSGRVIGRVPVVAAQAVERQRYGDALRKTLHSLYWL